MDLKNLSDKEFDVSFAQACRQERAALIVVLDHVTEAARRKHFQILGFNNLYEYMTEYRGHSDGAAQVRIYGARLLSDFPEIRECILNNEYKLSQLGVIGGAFRKSKMSFSEKVEVLGSLKNLSLDETNMKLGKDLGIKPKTKETRRRQADGTLSVHLVLSEERERLFEQIKSAMSHVNPKADLGEAFEFLAQKFLKEKTPRKSKPSQNPDYIPAQMRAEVCRKQKCCAWVDPVTGKKCNSTHQLEIDHKISRWMGGKTEISNLQRLCKHHNKLKYEIEIALYYAAKMPAGYESYQPLH